MRAEGSSEDLRDEYIPPCRQVGIFILSFFDMRLRDCSSHDRTKMKGPPFVVLKALNTCTRKH